MCSIETGLLMDPPVQTSTSCLYTPSRRMHESRLGTELFRIGDLTFSADNDKDDAGCDGGSAGYRRDGNSFLMLGGCLNRSDIQDFFRFCIGDAFGSQR